MASEGFFPGSKGTWVWSCRSCLSSTIVKNVCVCPRRYTSTSPHIFMMWCLLSSVLHARTPRPYRDILVHLYFTWLIVTFISCIRPLLVSCLALWTLPCVTCHFGRWPQHLTHMTGYKHTWPLYQKHVTRPVNYPATLCILNHFCCTSAAVRLHAVTFIVGAQGARLHPNATIKWLRTLLFWVFDHNLIPQILLTARLGLGIQHPVLCVSQALRPTAKLACDTGRGSQCKAWYQPGSNTRGKYIN
jgi:hypothetical protein